MRYERGMILKFRVTTSLTILVVRKSSFLSPYLRFSSTYFEIKNRCGIYSCVGRVRLSLSTYTRSLFSAHDITR